MRNKPAILILCAILLSSLGGSAAAARLLFEEGRNDGCCCRMEMEAAARPDGCGCDSTAACGHSRDFSGEAPPANVSGDAQQLPLPVRPTLAPELPGTGEGREFLYSLPRPARAGPIYLHISSFLI